MNIVPRKIGSNLESNLNVNRISSSILPTSLLNMAIDKIDLKIIEELLNYPDGKSSDLAKKLQIPLSTFQRRKTKLEEVLEKRYFFDYSQIGYRIAEVFLNVKNGKTGEISDKILKTFNKNVLKISSRIDSDTNLCIKIIFKDSFELHNILESLRSIEFISNLSFSEIVRTIENNTPTICINILKNEFDLQDLNRLE